MHILSPANGPREARAVIDEGAGEIYCGVMPTAWRNSYSNVASPNRREWAVSNMTSYDDVAAIVDIAHARGVRVFLTLNALYTEKQYPELEKFVHQAMQSGVDAVIAADIGLLLSLRDMGWERDIHVSTGGTTFNDETVDFYRSLGAVRVIIPRQNRTAEIAAIARNNPDIEIETFIMNRGCKNIDGFCTFHHGVNEVRIPLWWQIPKKMHCDYYLLSIMKRLPLPVREKIAHTSMFGSVGACFLSYDIDIEPRGASGEQAAALYATLRNNFNLFSGFDTCGACALFELVEAGVESIKIVGRSNPPGKKIKDVRFLSACLRFLKDESPSRDEFTAYTKKTYRKTFGFACDSWCYFPDEDSALKADVL